MAPSYTVVVRNQSGHSVSYNITQETPSVDSLAGNPWPLVISRSGKVPPGASASFKIDIPNPYYAYALSSQGKPGHGSNVQVIYKLPVVIGKKDGQGEQPGSSIEHVVVEEVPFLKDTYSPSGINGGFKINTGADFTTGDAKKGHYLLGYGSEEKVWSGFVPEPSMSYQIFPGKFFYLFFSDLQQGQLLDVKTVGPALKLDFGALESDEVTVTHRETGDLVIDE